MRKNVLFSFLLITLAAIVACGSDSDGPEAQADEPTSTPVSTPTGAEQAYLDDVEAADMLVGQNFEAFSEAINQVYPTRGALFGALKEAGAGTAFDDGLAAMETLEPPGRFSEEHELALADFREFQRLDGQVGQAVDDNDLVAFALANVRLAAFSVEAPLHHSAAFCLARFASAPPHLCERPDFSSSEEYGEAIYAISSRIEINVRPAFAGQLPALTDEEVQEVLGAVAPSAVDALERIEEDANALDPPEGLEADHDRLVQYLGDLVIVVTEWREAVESGALEAARAQIPRLVELSCTATDELSPAILPFLVVHFGGPTSCDGPPTPGEQPDSRP